MSPAAPTPALVLASGSPRRRVLLGEAGVRFQVTTPNVAEELREGETASELVERLAREKALAVCAALDADTPRFVLGADTVVVLDGDVLGKPRDPKHAVELLSRLLGRRHTVLTGVAVARTNPEDVRSFHQASHVQMRRCSQAEVREYVASGEPLDKAGAYALQGRGGDFVEKVEGSRSNVIGLPVAETLALLVRCGWTPES